MKHSGPGLTPTVSPYLFLIVTASSMGFPFIHSEAVNKPHPIHSLSLNHNLIWPKPSALVEPHKLTPIHEVVSNPALCKHLD